MIADVRRLDEDEKRFTFYDANNGGMHDFTSDEFFDAGHLCYTGAKKLSARVDSVFKEVLKQ